MPSDKYAAEILCLKLSLQETAQSRRISVRADDGEVEFLGLEDVAGDALYVGRSDGVDTF